MIVVAKNRYRSVCQRCAGNLVPVARQRKVTLRGVLALFMLLLGVTVMPMSIGWGTLVAVIALVIGLSGNRKYTVLVCVECGAEGREL